MILDTPSIQYNMKTKSQESLSTKCEDDHPPKANESRKDSPTSRFQLPWTPTSEKTRPGPSNPPLPPWLNEGRNGFRYGNAFTSSSDDRRWCPLLVRPDRQTRWTTIALISDVMRNERLTPVEVVDILTDLEEACKKDAVPFSELLYEDVEGAGASPLLLEIVRCDWKQAPELVEYLIHKTKGPRVSWMIRQGCRVTGDNELFQALRDALDEKPCYSVDTEDQISGFSATLGIDDLAGELAESQRYRKEIENSALLMGYRRSKMIELEWVVGGRVWSLEISEDLLSLTLTEGAGCIVTASVTIIAENSGDSSGSSEKNAITSFFEVAFPPSCEIHPLSSNGVHRISATIPWDTPTFPSSFYELISERPRINFLVSAQVGEIAYRFGVKGLNQDPFLETSGIDEVSWEDVSTLAQEDDEKWVLASWQGRDEDAT